MTMPDNDENDVQVDENDLDTEVDGEEVEETDEEAGETEGAGANGAAPPGKYRIGDQNFNTLAEAHAFATSHIDALETQTAIANAYRQGITDARGNPIPQPSVTPPEDDINEEEFYADPKAFLKNFATKIKTETQAEIDAKSSAREQDNAIWNEFSARHPNLADFRVEADQFATAHAKEIAAIAATKGRPAVYDFVALKMKSQFERYAQATKPKRQLPNTSGGPSPTSRGTSVTLKADPKKPLSFAEQIRQSKRVK